MRKRPPMQIHDWVEFGRGISLEQAGLLIQALHFHWVEQPLEIDEIFIDRIRLYACRDPRKFKRLWTSDLHRRFEALRRARKPVDWFDRERVRKRHGNKCVYCGCELYDDNASPNGFHVDHKKPVRRGGTGHIDNLVASCRTCNLSKGAFHDGSH